MEENLVFATGDNMNEDDERLVSSGDAAIMIGVSKSYICSLEQKGLLLPARRFPTGKRLYRVGDIEAFIRRIETGGTD